MVRERRRAWKNINGSCGEGFIHRPVGKWVRAAGSQPTVKCCCRHYIHNDQVQMILWWKGKAWWDSPPIPFLCRNTISNVLFSTEICKHTWLCFGFFFFFFINSDGDIKEWHSRSKLSFRVSANRRFISICLSRTARRLHSHPAVLNITMRPVPQ